MIRNRAIKYTFLGIWILNCVLGILIAIREVWIPHMDAKEDPYTHIISDPFDGTSMPIASIPDWTQLKYQDKSLQFHDIPKSALIPLPIYNAGQLLQPSIERSNIIAKFTYTVPYMGSYLLNYKEYDGSHLGVDIRAVIGTPVLAIANGVVIKTVESDPTGNKYVVVRHDKVPLNGGYETLYSGYLHLSHIHVTAGSKVKKGTIIGRVGTTGITTTPHLHFQIDRASAPFHPYWPYTPQEARERGLSFLSAVTAGVGKENAQKHTIHPMNFVQEHLSLSEYDAPAVGATTGGQDAVLGPRLEDIATLVPSNSKENAIPTEYNPRLEDIAKTIQNASVIVAGSVISRGNGCTTRFDDIEIYTELNMAIGFLQERSCLFGTIGGIFGADIPMSRGAGLEMLMRFHQLSPQGDKSPITDIPASNTTLHGYAAIAFEYGILRGNTLSPDRTITRGEFIEFLSRFGHLPNTTHQIPYYEDVGTDSSFFGSIQKYTAIVGTKGRLFHPDAPLTRGEAAILLGALHKMQK